MDRIDTHGSKGISSTSRAKGAAPVARVDAVGQVGSAAAKTDGIELASVVSLGSDVPVDRERVVEIRKAIEHGRYPITPARIADAMIAAGYLLRTRA